MPVKKVCVITGGTSGIGLCTAQVMLEKGYMVYELSRRAEGAPGMKHIDRKSTRLNSSHVSESRMPSSA